MALSIQQRSLAEAKNSGLTDHEACRSAGYKGASDRASCNQVARMMQNSLFVTYLNELRSKSTSSSVKTSLEVKEGLSRMMDTAEANNDFSAYVQLANRLSKMSGWDNAEKLEVSTVGSVLEMIRSKHS